MDQQTNKDELKEIGKRIQTALDNTVYSVEDLIYMTGFTRKTVTSILKGNNTDLIHLLGLAKAIGVQPRTFFDMEFSLVPVHPLSPQRLARIQLTKKINKIVSETDFFNENREVKDVVNFLSEEFATDTNSTNISVVLKRMAEAGKLIYTKSGRKNVYKKKSS